MPEQSYEQFADNAMAPPVRGFLHRSSQASGDGLVLTHGAGSTCQTDLLRSLAEVFADIGLTVLRVNLPFRQQRPSGPPRPGDAVIDQAGLKNAVLSMLSLGAKRVFLGGHSYGGRQATMLCASEPNLVSGLVLFSYPLHPPAKPGQLRTKHFPDLKTPAMFVHGTRDGFGSLQEMEKALKEIPAKTRLVPMEGVGHELRLKMGDAQEIARIFQQFLLE
jgi:predicted alpha/beta-hydrolase family hydrolase